MTWKTIISAKLSKSKQVHDCLATQWYRWSLGRVERWWKVPCTTDGHKQQEPVVVDAQGPPDLHRWWGNPDYRQE